MNFILGTHFNKLGMYCDVTLTGVNASSEKWCSSNRKEAHKDFGLQLDFLCRELLESTGFNWPMGHNCPKDLPTN